MPELVSNNAYVRLDSPSTLHVPGASDDQKATVTQLDSGGFVVAWQAGSAIWGQLYDSNGDSAGHEFQVGAEGFSSPTNVSVAGLANGGFVAVWEAVQTPDDAFVGVGVQLFDSSGSAIGDAFTANTTTEGGQQQPVVTVLTSGDFVVAWTDANSSTIVAQMFNSDGTPVGTELPVSTGYAVYPQITSLPDGGFVVGWADTASKASLQLYDSSGNAVGDPVDFAGGSGGVYDLTVLASGNTVVVWPTSTGELMAEIVDSSGHPAGSAFMVNAPTDGTEILPSVTALASGEFVVSWRAPTDAPNYFQMGDIVGQRFAADGAKVGEQFVIAGSPDGESGAQITSFGSNDLAVAYTHFEPTGLPEVNVQLLYSTVPGTSASETLAGTPDRDFIFGFAGNDLLSGGAGNDSLYGGTGDDRLFGEDGNDVLDGGAGADQLKGGAGDDSYYVDNAGDAVTEYASAGNDTVFSAISYALGSNVETLRLTGSAAINATGNAQDNLLVGNSGANVLNGGGGADTMWGGGGNDSYYVDNAGDHIAENAGAGSDTVFSSVSFTLSDNIETLRLTGSAAINAFGNAQDNLLVGNAGANVLGGGDGNDTLWGSGGDDRLYGEGGNDSLDGGAGADTMYGGAGDDAYYVDNAGDHVVEYSGAGYDTVFSTISYTLSTTVEVLRLTGSAAIDATGNAAGNLLVGNIGNNILSGGAGGDKLWAGDGNDTLVGGAGADSMAGGAGSDTFVFADGDFGGTAPGTSDMIQDFSHAEGDRIDLAHVDANTLAGGDQAFTFLGTGAFTGTAGELRYEQLSGDTFVYGDTNGDGIADFMIELHGAQTLTSGDFVI